MTMLPNMDSEKWLIHQLNSLNELLQEYMGQKSIVSALQKWQLDNFVENIIGEAQNMHIWAMDFSSFLSFGARYFLWFMQM